MLTVCETRAKKNECAILVSDAPEKFTSVGELFFGKKLGVVRRVVLEKDRLKDEKRIMKNEKNSTIESIT